MPSFAMTVKVLQAWMTGCPQIFVSSVLHATREPQ